jgi:hypothetical protein
MKAYSTPFTRVLEEEIGNAHKFEIKIHSDLRI